MTRAFRVTADGREYELSEVEFRPDEGFPICLGYMVGADDGASTLYQTPEKAIAAFRAVETPREPT